jgi:hypothetical protein
VADRRLGIIGHVYDMTARPVPDAVVIATTFELAGNLPSPVGSARSDAQGRFEIPLPDGTYQLNASRDGYGPISTIARTGELVSLVLQQSGMVVGHVRDEQARPVPQFVIEVTSATPANMPTPAPLWARSFNSPDGSYRADQLPPWSMIVKAVAPGYAPAFSRPLKVGPGETHQLDLTLAVGCTLLGTVEDRTGTPAPYVLLSAESRLIAGSASGLSANASNQTQSDPQGRFKLEHVPLGAVLVRAYDDSHAVTTVTVDVKSCDQLAPVKLVMSGGGSIEGVARGGDGRPLPHARLTASHRSIGFVATRSDEQGRFRFDRLPPGKVRMELHHEGQRTLAIGTVKEGETTRKDITLFAQGRGEIRGRITASGRPLPYARLLVASNHPRMGIDTYYPTAGPDGMYRVTGLPEGQYIIHISASTRSRAVMVPPGGVVTVDLDVAQAPERTAQASAAGEDEVEERQEAGQQPPAFAEGPRRQRPPRKPKPPASAPATSVQ